MKALYASGKPALREALLLCTALLVAACAGGPVAEPPAVIHAGVHSGGSVVSFSEDGELLASGGWEGTVRLWRTPAGSQLRYWRDHSDSVNGIAFVDHDSQVITAGYDGLLVRRAVSGARLASVETGSPVTHMVADSGTNRVLTGHADGVVRIWQVSDFALLQERNLHRGAVMAVAMDGRSGRFASSGADGRVFVWTATGAERALQEPPVDAWTLAFSPDGHTLSGGSWFYLYQWNLDDGKLTTIATEHRGIIKSIQYIDEGRELATISRQTDSAVYFLDAESGAVRRRFQRHDLCGADVAVSADGRYLATTSDDASVHVWLLEKGGNAGE